MRPLIFVVGKYFVSQFSTYEFNKFNQQIDAMDFGIVDITVKL
jgi:hypothetical protein